MSYYSREITTTEEIERRERGSDDRWEPVDHDGYRGDGYEYRILVVKTTVERTLKTD